MRSGRPCANGALTRLLVLQAAFLLAPCAFSAPTSAQTPQTPQTPKTPKTPNTPLTPQKAALSLPGNTDATTITLTAVSPAWSHRIAIDLEPKTPAKVTVTADTLYRDDGPGVPLTVVKPGASEAASQTFDVTSWPHVVVVAAKGLAKGTYVGTLKISVDGGPEIVRAIKLTRTPANYTLGTSRKVIADGFLDWRPDIKFAIPIAAPSEHGVTLTPALFQVRRTAGADSIEVKDANLSYAVGEQAVTASAPLALKAKEVQRLTVRMPGPLEAGTYQGDIKLVSDDLDTQTFSFEVSVRKFWAWILVPVLLGAGVSLWFKDKVKNVRPRMVIRQIVAQLQGQAGVLRASRLTTFEGVILDAIEARIDAIRALAVGPDELDANNAKAALLLDGAKLRAFAVWTNARRTLDSVGLPEAMAKPFRDKLVDLGKLLRDDAAIPSANEGDFSKLLADIESAAQAAWQAAIDALSKNIADEQNLTDPKRQAMAFGLLRDAAESVGEAASAALHRNEAAMDEAFERARTLLFQAQAEKLRPNVPDDPTGAQIASDTGYLGGSPKALLRNIGLALEARDSRDAEYYYRRAQGDVDAARESAHRLLALEAAPQGQANPDLTAFVDTPLTTSAVEVPRLPLRSTAGPVLPPGQLVVDDPAALLRDVRGIDRMATILTLLITGALGVLVLWNADPTWGKPMDWFVAFFWGLGLGEVTKNTFTGVVSLRTTLSS